MILVIAILASTTHAWNLLWAGDEAVKKGVPT